MLFVVGKTSPPHRDSIELDWMAPSNYEYYKALVALERTTAMLAMGATPWLTTCDVMFDTAIRSLWLWYPRLPGRGWKPRC